MSDIKLFRTNNGAVEELKGTSVQLEKSLQTLIEQNLETFLGIRFLASEHNTGKVHGGRIDTLGIDENGCPVIIEYKKALNENVINQGLFYLDWLMDHKADFKLLAIERLGKEAGDHIEWGASRLICIAGDFTNYDEHAVKQIPRSIELIRYRRYDDHFLLFELVNADSATTIRNVSLSGPRSDFAPVARSQQPYEAATGKNYLDQKLTRSSEEVRDCFEALKAFFFALGDDMQMRVLTGYIVFARIKTIAYVWLRPRSGDIVVGMKLLPDAVSPEPGFCEITSTGVNFFLRTTVDVSRAAPYLQASYDAT